MPAPRTFYRFCFLLVVIHTIQVEDFSIGLLDFRNDPPDASDGEAAGSLATSGDWASVQSLILRILELSGNLL